jgi:hypothetical protein
MLIGPLLQREDGVVASAKIGGGAIGRLVVLLVAANVVVVGRKCRNSLLLICKSKGA